MGDTLLGHISHVELVRPSSAYLSLRDTDKLTEAQRELLRALSEQDETSVRFVRFLAYDRGRRAAREALL